MNVILKVHTTVIGQYNDEDVLLLDAEIDNIHRILSTKGLIMAVDALRKMYQCSTTEAKRCVEYIAENYMKEKFRLLKEILSAPS